MSQEGRLGIAGAVILSIGLMVGGWALGNGVARARSSDRYVTVKGVSEREVRADTAVWPIGIVASDNDLTRAHAKLEASVEEVRSFLSRHGIDPATAQVLRYSVSDAQTNQYMSSQAVGSRFVIYETLVVRTGDPDKVLAASAKIGELVSAGVVLSTGSESGWGGPGYLFTGLNRLKPEMIAEATARAREGAEQFAKDSGARVGGIRRASQGVFEILPRNQAPGVDEGGQVEKTVRVVTTVEYLLES